MVRFSQTCSRRRAVREIAAGSAVLLPALTAREVDAGRTWCRTDPVVKINGHTANIYVSAHVRDMKQARSLAIDATEIVITVPHGVHVQDLAHDRGFGHGYRVRIAHTTDLQASSTGIPVRIEAHVPMRRDDVPIKVQFAPRRRRGFLRSGQGKGTANAWIVFDAG